MRSPFPFPMRKDDFMDISKIDRNFSTASATERDTVFYSAKEAPFAVYGFSDSLCGGDFIRMPDSVAQTVSAGVAALSRNTAGGRLRFSTDSARITIRCRLSAIAKMSHMPLISSAGFDLYLDNPQDGSSRFCGAFKPPMDMTDGFEATVSLNSRILRSFTLNFPSYSNVDRLEIGLESNANLTAGQPYLPIHPIVYYGSSITQGACASRPGNAYPNIICRRNRIDFLNFGFSGSAKGEEAMARHLASLKMSVFVSDYDHNASPEKLDATHARLYHIIREAHPDIPYVIVTMPDFYKQSYEINQLRRDICYRTYIDALHAGDQNISFIDGGSLFGGQDEDACTVDMTHPNDYGMLLMANRIGAELNRIRDKQMLC